MASVCFRIIFLLSCSSLYSDFFAYKLDWFSTVCGSVWRYPDDPYDRFWWPMENASPGWVNLSTTRPIQPDRSHYAVPSRILQTAVAPSGNDTALTAITWQYQTKYSFMIFQHFADFPRTPSFGSLISSSTRRMGRDGNSSPTAPRTWLHRRCTLNPTGLPTAGTTSLLFAPTPPFCCLRWSMRSRSTFASRTRIRRHSLKTVRASPLIFLKFTL
jgi:hypothetical protein